MILGQVFEQFVEKSPISVMARASVEFAFSHSMLDSLFADNAEHQYTRTLLFSSVVDLIAVVVTGSFSSIYTAFQKSDIEIPVSVTSVYNKLQGIEPTVSAQLVCHSAARLAPVQRQLGGTRKPWLEGYRIRILDGNHLAATEHRLKETRLDAAGPLPGQALVLYEPELELVTAVLLVEDGHAQERASLDDVLEQLHARDLVIADRNMCVRAFLLGIAARGGFFVIREHAGLNWEAAGKLRRLGRTESGRVAEQRICIYDDNDEPVYLRRVVVELDEPTEDGDTQLAILSNVPKEDADARTIAKLYRRRWTIEGAFLELAVALQAEINTLCYPKAALFGFAVGLLVSALSETFGVSRGRRRNVGACRRGAGGRASSQAKGAGASPRSSFSGPSAQFCSARFLRGKGRLSTAEALCRGRPRVSAEVAWVPSNGEGDPPTPVR
jgi:hypothetical protein